MSETEPKGKSTRGRNTGQTEGNNVEFAYNWIKSQILSGKFKAGDVLLQGELAKQCNTSRGPVREALRMLQNQGLIESEANQRGRVASFTARDLEQTVASGILVAGGTIACRKDGWRPDELKRINKLIDQHKALSEKLAGASMRSDLVSKRLMIFHDLVMEICTDGGSFVQKVLAEHFDRIIIFRQMAGVREGNKPAFPLGANMDDLREKIAAHDCKAVAQIVVTSMADLGRFALDRMGEYHLGAEIDRTVAFIRAGLGAEIGDANAREIRTSVSQTVNVELKGSSTLIWSFPAG